MNHPDDLDHAERVEIVAIWLFRSKMNLLNNPAKAVKMWTAAMEESQREDWRSYARWFLNDLLPPAALSGLPESGPQLTTFHEEDEPVAEVLAAFESVPQLTTQAPPPSTVDPFPYGSVYVWVGEEGEPVDTMARERLSRDLGDDGNIDFDHHGRVVGVEVLGAQRILVDNVEVWSRGQGTSEG